MEFSHTRPVVSASFDDANLVSAAGLVPVMRLAERAGLRKLAQRWLSVPTDKGANAGLKIASLIGGMVAGADSIDDMGLLRHGGMRKVFSDCYAPSTLGSFLRSFTFGHVRQLDAVAARFLSGLAAVTPVVSGIDQQVLVDIDDTIKQVHGYQKQGSGYGYTSVRGLNALIGTVTTAQAAPVIVGARLRQGACASQRGADKFVSDVLGTVKRLRSNTASGTVLLRADSAYYSYPVVAAAIRAGAAVSITAKMNPQIAKAIASIEESEWIPIKYTNAIRDEVTGNWISDAEVAEVPFTAFTRQKKHNQIPGRLVVRRVVALNPHARTGQGTLFDTHRYHAFFTTSTMDKVTADSTHRGHAIIENVHADLKNGALAHLPSGKFPANAAWLVLTTIAFNLTRAAAAMASSDLAKATTGTIRRKLVSVPARIASSARRLTLHLPSNWPWETAWLSLFASSSSPPRAAAI